MSTNITEDLKRFDDVPTKGQKISETRKKWSLTKQAFQQAGLDYTTAAKICGVSRNTVQSWVNNNDFPPVAAVKIYLEWFSGKSFTDVFAFDKDWYMNAINQCLQWREVAEVLTDQSMIERYFPEDVRSVEHELKNLLKVK